MDLPRLIEGLTSPAAYPHPVEEVEVWQTHLSVVFLAGPFVYKLKKPVSLGFVDFRSLEGRLWCCQEEVRLNRALAPGVYHGVVPVTRGPSGSHVRVGGDGLVLDWLVKMERLPDSANLVARLERGQLGPPLLDRVAHRLVDFHSSQPGGGKVPGYGRFDVVAGNARDNLRAARAQLGAMVPPPVLDRLDSRLESALALLRPLLDARAAREVPRDTHGDLRLEHIYHFPERPAPSDLLIIDRVEFSERFRYADPVADMAFLVMDLLARGEPELAGAFRDSYFQARGDPEGPALLPFYVSYRAAVRAKVEGLRALEPEVPAGQRESARERARGLWLLALGQLEEAPHRPCLVLLAGLPGAGKSTLARALAEGAGFEVVRSDVVRKELAGPAREDLYTAEWNDRTYAECLRRADEVLLRGGRVLVDANFRQEQRRRDFLGHAVRRGVPCLLLVCQAQPEVVRKRLMAREGDASDADWAVYQQLARTWEELGEGTRRRARVLDTSGSAEEGVRQALAALREVELA